MTPLPKLLPWIARKAGISDATAADLWTQAARQAGLQAGATSGAESYRIALQYLQEMVIAATTSQENRLAA